MSLMADEITFTYPGSAQAAITKVSFELQSGEIGLVAGQTGSGKSTLMKLLAGLLAPDAGTVTINGQAPRPESCALVFQQPHMQLFAESVGLDVMFGPKNMDATPEEAKLEAEQALSKVGLPPAEFFERSPFSLSGGQARRAAIAGVLAMKPAYYIFDEPTAGLDGQGREFVKHLVKELAAEGAGVVVVTHDLDELAGIADGLLLLMDGCHVWSGPVSEAVANPNIFRLAQLTPPELLVFQEEVVKRTGNRFDFSLNPAVVAQRVAASLGEVGR